MEKRVEVGEWSNALTALATGVTAVFIGIQLWQKWPISWPDVEINCYRKSDGSFRTIVRWFNQTDRYAVVEAVRLVNSGTARLESGQVGKPNVVERTVDVQLAPGEADLREFILVAPDGNQHDRVVFEVEMRARTRRRQRKLVRVPAVLPKGGAGG